MPARQIHVSGAGTTGSYSPLPPTRSAQTRLVPTPDITSLSVPARWPVGVPHLPEGPRGVTRETPDTRRGAGAAVAHGYCAANTAPRASDRRRRRVGAGRYDEENEQSAGAVCG